MVTPSFSVNIERLKDRTVELCRLFVENIENKEIKVKKNINKISAQFLALC